jgi:phospholipid transport system substrate-binding protein
MILKKNFLKIIFIFFLSISFIEKSFSIEPNVFVQSTVNRASKVLSGNFTKQEKMEELENIAKETVDINGIGSYTLGKHRKNLTTEQTKIYRNLFEKYFLKTFTSRLAEYTNPEVRVELSDKLNKNYTMVHSVLVATEQRSEIKIDWRIYTKDPENLLIRDLIIEGLSLARTQKEEFNSIILSNNGNVDYLFVSMNEFINK